MNLRRRHQFSFFCVPSITRCTTCRTQLPLWTSVAFDHSAGSLYLFRPTFCVVSCAARIGGLLDRFHPFLALNIRGEVSKLGHPTFGSLPFNSPLFWGFAHPQATSHSFPPTLPLFSLSFKPHSTLVPLYSFTRSHFIAPCCNIT
jgi:hypothetical protein